jgi:hypothetical protein
VDLIKLVLILAVGFLVAWFVGFITKRVFARQQLTAKQLNELAGVLSVQAIDEAERFGSLAEVIKKRPPRESIRLLAVSGRSVFSPPILSTLLQNTIKIQALLLDPTCDDPLLREHPWLVTETRDTLALLQQKRTEDNGSRSIDVRVYRGAQLQLLMFIDDDRLFVSSFFPVASMQRLVYEIRPGERSLYRLFKEGFEYTWRHSSYLEKTPNKGPQADTSGAA